MLKSIKLAVTVVMHLAISVRLRITRSRSRK